MKYVCTVCGYVYEGESLPADFVCPVCKAPASKFAAQTGEREWAAEHVVGVAKGVSEDRGWYVPCYGKSCSQRGLSRNRSLL